MQFAQLSVTAECLLVLVAVSQSESSQLHATTATERPTVHRGLVKNIVLFNEENSDIQSTTEAHLKQATTALCFSEHLIVLLNLRILTKYNISQQNVLIKFATSCQSSQPQITTRSNDFLELRTSFDNACNSQHTVAELTGTKHYRNKLLLWDATGNPLAAMEIECVLPKTEIFQGHFTEQQSGIKVEMEVRQRQSNVDNAPSSKITGWPSNLTPTTPLEVVISLSLTVQHYGTLSDAHPKAVAFDCVFSDFPDRASIRLGPVEFLLLSGCPVDGGSASVNFDRTELTNDNAVVISTSFQITRPGDYFKGNSKSKFLHCKVVLCSTMPDALTRGYAQCPTNEMCQAGNNDQTFYNNRRVKYVFNLTSGALQLEKSGAPRREAIEERQSRMRKHLPVQSFGRQRTSNSAEEREEWKGFDEDVGRSANSERPMTTALGKQALKAESISRQIITPSSSEKSSDGIRFSLKDLPTASIRHQLSSNSAEEREEWPEFKTMDRPTDKLPRAGLDNEASQAKSHPRKLAPAGSDRNTDGRFSLAWLILLALGGFAVGSLSASAAMVAYKSITNRKRRAQYESYTKLLDATAEEPLFKKKQASTKHHYVLYYDGK